MKRILVGGLGGLGRELIGYLQSDQAAGYLAEGIEISGLDDAYPETFHLDKR